MARLGHVAGVLLSTGAALFVAGTAFALAYGGSKGAAIDAGMSSPGWFPWCIEGVIVVSSLSVVALPRGERTLAWVVLLASTAVSVVANVLHALDHPGHEWWSPYFAAVPPLTLPLCMQLAERVALSLRPPRGTPALDIPVGHPAAVGQVSTPQTPTPGSVGGGRLDVPPVRPAAPVLSTAGPDSGTGQDGGHPAPPDVQDNVAPLDEPGWKLVARAYNITEAAARKRVERGGDRVLAQARARVNGHKP